MSNSVTSVVNNKNDIVSSTQTYYQNVQKLLEKEPKYANSGLSGYNPEVNYDTNSSRLPTVYDGIMYDSNMYQIYDSTFYVAGMVVCATLLITGVIMISEK